MAKDKEKRQNPATAHLKSQKKAAIKKSKTELSKSRSEKLSKRNPLKIQQQIDQLKEQEQKYGSLKGREKQQLERLQREVGSVKRARERLGVKDDERESFGRSERGGESGVLGKRRRDDSGFANRRHDDSSDTDPEARDIPMPLDVENMPPIPRRKRPQQQSAPVEPVAPAVTVYSSAPQVRDLRKEAVSRFVPAAVASKIAATKGTGGKLLEPEEADKLEKSGYVAAERVVEEAEKEVQFGLMAREEAEGEADTLEEEERRFMDEVRAVEEDGGGFDEDVRGVADEAAMEVQYELMDVEERDGVAEMNEEQAKRVKRVVMRVEMEEVDDEDL